MKIGNILNLYLLGFIIACVVCVCCFTMLNTQMEKQFLNSTQEKTNIVIELIRESILLSDYQTIQKATERLVHNSEIQFIEIKNSYDQIIAQQGQQEKGRDSYTVSVPVYQDEMNPTKSIGTLKIIYTYSVISKLFEKYFIIVIALTLFLLLLLLLIFYALSKSVNRFFQHLISQFNVLEGGTTTKKYYRAMIKEYGVVTRKLFDASIRIQKLIAKEQEATKLQAISNTARQVAHDIRSPLAALSMVSSGLKELPEEERILIRTAVQRIEDIANDLSNKRPEA
ncbi:MAG: hypothetical protein ACD_62C00692G0001, partial [uncultured bacterium]